MFLANAEGLLTFLKLWTGVGIIFIVGLSIICVTWVALFPDIVKNYLSWRTGRNQVSKHTEADNSDLVEWWMDANYKRHLGGRVDVSIAFDDMKRYCNDAPKDFFPYLNFVRIIKDLYLVGSEAGQGRCFIANLRPNKRGETLHRMPDGSVARREEISTDSHNPSPQTPVA